MKKLFITSLLWDNDGVLVDTEKFYFQAARETLASVAIDLSFAQFLQISLQEGRSVFDIAREKNVTDTSIQALRLQRNKRYKELLEQGVDVFPGVYETLTKLESKITLGIVTSSLREHFDIIHRSTDLLRYFDFVLTREAYSKTKPYPDPYLTAIDDYGLKKESCLIIEDSLRGLHAAKRAGIHCIVVRNSYNSTESFSEAYAVINSIEELFDIINY